MAHSAPMTPTVSSRLRPIGYRGSSLPIALRAHTQDGVSSADQPLALRLDLFTTHPEPSLRTITHLLHRYSTTWDARSTPESAIEASTAKECDTKKAHAFTTSSRMFATRLKYCASLHSKIG